MRKGRAQSQSQSPRERQRRSKRRGPTQPPSPSEQASPLGSQPAVVVQGPALGDASEALAAARSDAGPAESIVEPGAVVGARSEAPTSLEAMVTTVAGKSERPPAAAADLPPAAGATESSIPPAGDLAVDEKFFSDGELSLHRHTHAADLWEDVKPPSRKHEPHVVQRRERFARYVKWAVAGASVLCFVAIGRSAVSSARSVTPGAALAKVTVPGGAAAPTTEQPKVAAAKLEVGAIEPAAAKADDKPVEPVAAKADDKPAGVVDAKHEKSSCREALERGKVDDAISAGERSVTADAEDGEAWLILGAAYQEKGKMADARRCYTACLKQGKRGPKSECSAMLR